MTLIAILANFSLARAQLPKMEVNYTELQAVHVLVKGLLTYSSWISFTQITNTYISAIGSVQKPGKIPLTEKPLMHSRKVSFPG